MLLYLVLLLHPPLAEQQPVEADLLLHGEGDQEVGMGGRSVFVAVDILLENPEIACELSLRATAAYLGDAIRELALDAL